MRGILPLMKLFLTNFWKSMQGTDCVFAWSHLKEGPWLALVGSICRHQRRGMRADPLQGYGTKEECREGSRGPGGGGGGGPAQDPSFREWEPLAPLHTCSLTRRLGSTHCSPHSLEPSTESPEMSGDQILLLPRLSSTWETLGMSLSALAPRVHSPVNWVGGGGCFTAP